MKRMWELSGGILNMRWNWVGFVCFVLLVVLLFFLGCYMLVMVYNFEGKKFFE